MGGHKKVKIAKLSHEYVKIRRILATFAGLKPIMSMSVELVDK
jgi:hypothetical protein